MSSSKSVLVAALVAFVAGALSVGQRYVTALAFEWLNGPSATELSFYALGSRLLVLTVEPLGVFLVGYVLARRLDVPRSVGALGLGFALGAAVGGIVALAFASLQLNFARESLGVTALGLLEAILATGLRVAVAGVAGATTRYALEERRGGGAGSSSGSGSGSGSRPHVDAPDGDGNSRAEY